MRWVAPTEKDEANHQLEKRLWAAADQFRANSGLKAGEYSGSVLGLIFLRFAEARFAKRRAELEKAVSLEKVYATPTVVQIEAAGYEVLGGLLERVVPAIVRGPKGGTAANRKVLELVPPQFRRGNTEYERLLSTTDFVSGMTDTYAVTLYRRLSGIELPRGN